jgi:hypothetical protein
MPYSGMLGRVALVGNDISEERIASIILECKKRRFGVTIASIIRVTRLGELGTLAVISNYIHSISSQRALVAGCC